MGCGTLAEKRAVVLGGSRGIGEAIVRQLVADGADVTFSFFEGVERAAKLSKELNIKSFKCDNANSTEVTASISLLGPIDILVVNSGVGIGGAAEALPTVLVERMFAVNVGGAYFSTVAALPSIRYGGRIIYIGSTVGSRMAAPGLAAYAASKAALHGMARGLCRELGFREITVNVIEPGPTDTDMNPAEGPYAEEMHIPLAIKRHIRPEEVAALVGFIAGPSGAMITGAIIPIDGGSSA